MIDLKKLRELAERAVEARARGWLVHPDLDLWALETAGPVLKLINEFEDLRHIVEAIRCNTEPDTLGNFCDAADEGPHELREHYAAHLRAVNSAATTALKEKDT